LTVIAEGVETAAVNSRLVALGCDAIQGTFVSPPRSAEATRSWFASLQ